jgi:hypothetical protein
MSSEVRLELLAALPDARGREVPACLFLARNDRERTVEDGRQAPLLVHLL